MATAFQTLVSQLSEFTSGEDGLNFKSPTWVGLSFEPLETEVLGPIVVLIGGMGTLYGAVIGSVLFVLAQNYLQDLLKLAASAVEGVPVLAAVLTPDRWLLWLGVLFVLSVYYFPTGVVGRLRARAMVKTGQARG